MDSRTSSREALEFFRKEFAEKSLFDLVITDMTMPNFTGVDLAGEIIKLQPDIPILLCTGFNEAANPEKSRANGIREVLPKPFSVKELAGLVRKLLDNDY